MSEDVRYVAKWSHLLDMATVVLHEGSSRETVAIFFNSDAADEYAMMMNDQIEYGKERMNRENND